MSDGHPVPAKRDPERGVGAGIDEPDAHALAPRRSPNVGVDRESTIDQKVRVGDIPGAAEDGGHHRPLTPVHVHHVVVHPLHPGICGVGTDAQITGDIVGSPTGPVDPVVKDHEPFMVVVAGLARIIDDHHSVQAPIELQTRM